jgi:2-polyprenyl-3-methyl-5-hydroxy-6-metoxy-1,4-benzoquinol methylase
MSDQPSPEIRQKAAQLAREYQQHQEPLAWFEVLYAQAQEDPLQIPWAQMTPHPILQDWLNSNNLSAKGKKALVIGCGLGDDAEFLSQLGFSVTAFDISPTAIAWCKKRFPESSVDYLVADLLALDSSWNGKFDLVVESRTIQSLPLEQRREVTGAIAPLVAIQGTLLVITHLRDTEEPPSGPPWALSESELAQFEELGFQEVKRKRFENRDVKLLRLEYLCSKKENLL